MPHVCMWWLKIIDQYFYLPSQLVFEWNLPATSQQFWVFTSKCKANKLASSRNLSKYIQLSEEFHLYFIVVLIHGLDYKHFSHLDVYIQVGQSFFKRNILRAVVCHDSQEKWNSWYSFTLIMSYFINLHPEEQKQK